MVESIYNLIEKPKQDVPKQPMYRSKYDPKAPLTGSTFGLHGTTVTVGKGINDLKRVREKKMKLPINYNALVSYDHLFQSTFQINTKDMCHCKHLWSNS